jgi:hypothetical protein
VVVPKLKFWNNLIYEGNKHMIYKFIIFLFIFDVSVLYSGPIKEGIYVYNRTNRDINVTLKFRNFIEKNNNWEAEVINSDGDKIILRSSWHGEKEKEVFIIPKNTHSKIIEYDERTGIGDIPFFDKLNAIIEELIIRDIEENIIYTLEMINDDNIEILPGGNGFVIHVTDPPQKVVSYNTENLSHFYIENNTELNLIIDGEFSNPRRFMTWTMTFSENTETERYLSIKQEFWNFPITNKPGRKEEIFNYTIRPGTEDISILEKLRMICPQLIIKDEENNVLYTLDTIRGENIIRKDMDYYLEIK